MISSKRQSMKSGTWLGLLAMVLAFLSHSALAQPATPPNAGSLKAQQPEVMRAQAKPDRALAIENKNGQFVTQSKTGLRVLVRQITLVGVSVFDEAVILDSVADQIGIEHSFSGLESIAATVTAQYRQAGYLMATAYLPQQSLNGGVLQINVSEGRVGHISTVSKSRLNEKLALAHVAGLENQPALHSRLLERKVRLLSDLPGVEVAAVFSPGAEVGTTQLRLKTEDTQLVTGHTSVDNLGNRFTDSVRFGGGVALNNALGRGEQFALQGVTSGDGYRYLAAEASTPIGANGIRLGAHFSDMKYRLKKEFSALRAKGDGEVSRVSVSFPWIRSLASNLHSELSVGREKYTDEIALAGTVSDKQLDVVRLLLHGDINSFNGDRTLWHLGASVGDVDDDFLTPALDAYDVLGSYAKLNAGLSHERWFADKWRVFAKVTAQYSNENLDSAEKFSLGGSGGVRAYPQGEGLVDVGVRASVELRYQLNQQWLLSGFFDAARGDRFRDELSIDRDNDQELSGVGVGVTWIGDDGWYLNATTAVRTGASPQTDTDRRPRLWLQMVKSF